MSTHAPESSRPRLRRVCVFAGSSPGAQPDYADAARQLGMALAERGCELVYGGASVGLMGAVADAAMASGAKVIGVLPAGLADKEIAHSGLTKLHIVDDMHKRKALMAELSDAVVCLPGGLGTLDELFETLTSTQLGFDEKSCGLLNVSGFYDPLLAFLDHAASQRFVSPGHREMLLSDDQPHRLLERLANYEHRPADKWLDRH